MLIPYIAVCKSASRAAIAINTMLAASASNRDISDWVRIRWMPSTAMR